MIQSLDDLNRYIKADCVANLDREYVPLFKLLVNVWYKNECYMAFRYMRMVRRYEYAINVAQKNGLFGKIALLYAKVRYHRTGFKYGVRVNPNVTAPGLRLPHLNGGTIVGCESMGYNCIVNAGVVIGTKTGTSKRPVIGNNCELAVGCKIIGDVTIGDNVIVAPNSVVVKDVPANAIVSGIPATILKYREI